MKRILFTLAAFAIRRLCGASATLWADLRGYVRMTDRGYQDGAPMTAEQKHTAVDTWLAQTAPFDATPALRKRLIQAAVLSVRLEEYFADLPTF